MVDKKQFENKVKRTFSLTKVNSSFEYTKNSITINLDFSRVTKESKRQEYYCSLINTLVVNDEFKLFKSIMICGKKNNQTLWKNKYQIDDLFS